MVTHWGMSDRLGPMSFRIGEEHVFLGKEIQEPRDFSEGTAAHHRRGSAEAAARGRRARLRAARRQPRQARALVEALLQKEELHKEEIDEIIRTHKLPPSNEPPSSDATRDADATGPVQAPGPPPSVPDVANVPKTSGPV